jgi:predicted nucleic acid-binding protein
VKRIYWDTMIHAYWFENNRDHGARVEHIYQVMLQRGDVLCSSILILSELLVGPVKHGDSVGVQAIEGFFDSGSISMLPYSRRAANIFAELRAHHGVKSLDALHLAIAADAGVDLFLTYDRHLNKLLMPGLPFIVSIDTDLF